MSKHRPIFVTGIDTGIGKTICAAVLKEALNADYWKPIQAGDLEESDSIHVSRLTGNLGKIHPEQFALQRPMAPHQAAKLEGLEMHLEDFACPNYKNYLVVEGAGGCMVPLNGQHTFLDLIQQLKASCVLVVKNYLGSINHTLLSIASIKNAGIPLLGIILIGEENKASELAYTQHGKTQIIGRIPWSPELTPAFIAETAVHIKDQILEITTANKL